MNVELGDIIGQGQFGDCHQGVYHNKDGEQIPVAVKTCKIDADSATADRFLEEACKWMFSLKFNLLVRWTISFCQKRSGILLNHNSFAAGF